MFRSFENNKNKLSALKKEGLGVVVKCLMFSKNKGSNHPVLRTSLL